MAPRRPSLLKYDDVYHLGNTSHFERARGLFLHEAAEALIPSHRLRDDPGIGPQYHIFVDSRAPWEELPDDGLPRYPERRP
jgi:hypothetical protein